MKISLKNKIATFISLVSFALIAFTPSYALALPENGTIKGVTSTPTVTTTVVPEVKGVTQAVTEAAAKSGSGSAVIYVGLFLLGILIIAIIGYLILSKRRKDQE